MRIRRLTLMLLCLTAVASTARAQRALDLQLYTPAAGPRLGLSAPEPAAMHHLAQDFALSVSHARRVLRHHTACADAPTPCLAGAGGGGTPLLSDLTQLELGYALGLFEALELGASLPFAIARTADDLTTPTRLEGHAGAADARLSAELSLSSAPLSLAASVGVTLPTGDDDQLLGQPRWSAAPGLIAAVDLGPARVALAARYLIRPRVRVLDLEQDDALELLLAGEIPVTGKLWLLGEAQLRWGLGGTDNRQNEAALEARAGVGLRALGPWSAELGVGLGFPPGDEGAGAPELRVLGAVGYRIGAAGCPYGPEDFDGYEDGDHCADPDDDGDGVPDVADACLDDPEDLDGFADDDGCPDPDNDVDGLPDTADACRDSSEDRDGYEDEDGCPELDNDGDGLLDGQDACAMDPEDADGFEDQDGCPEPGPAAPTVTLSEGRILVSERVYFEHDRDLIRAVSAPVLDQLATAVQALPAGRRVRVVGHTDGVGDATYNLDLSHRRARAVTEALVERGVPRERLVFEGRGGAEPIAPDDTHAGRALNRRVELLLE